MTNEEIKMKIKEARIHQYEVAAALDVSEYTFCKWFRKPLPPEKETAILNAIQRLKEGERVG